MQNSFTNETVKKTFYVKRIINDKEKSTPVRYRKNTVTVFNYLSEPVTFTRSNRSEYFIDTRDNERLNYDETYSEVKRLIENEETAKRAMEVLIEGI